MSYDKIINPITNRQNKISSLTGKKVLYNYIINYNNNYYGGDKGCRSKGIEPKDCENKKMYKKQALIFHPDYNQDCIKDAEIKFKLLAGKKGCNSSDNTETSSDESRCKEKIPEFFMGVSKCVKELGYTLEYLDENGRIITYDESSGQKPVPYRKYPVLDYDKAIEIKTKIIKIYNDCRNHLDLEIVKDMKEQINNYINPLLAEVASPFLPPNQQPSSKDNWDKKCGSNTDFKKQWKSEISNINSSLDTQSYSIVRSKQLSIRIDKLRKDYLNCKSIDGADLKQTEINKLKDELNKLIRKYSEFNYKGTGQPHPQYTQPSSEEEKCGESSNWRRNWNDKISSIETIIAKRYKEALDIRIKRIIDELNNSFEECKAYLDKPNRKLFLNNLDTIKINYSKWVVKTPKPGSDNWDKKCGSNSDFKKQWNSNISNIEYALDTQPYTHTRSKKLSIKIDRLKTDYENCKSIDVTGLKQIEINKLKAELNQLIRKYDKFNDKGFIDVEDLYTQPTDPMNTEPPVPDLPLWVTQETERTHLNLTKIILQISSGKDGKDEKFLMVAIEPPSGAGIFGETRKKIAVLYTRRIFPHARPVFSTIDMESYSQFFGQTVKTHAENPVNQNDINILIIYGGEICLLISTLDFHPKFLTKENYQQTRYIFKNLGGELRYSDINDFTLVFLNGYNTPSDLGDYYGERGSNLFALREFIRRNY